MKNLLNGLNAAISGTCLQMGYQPLNPPVTENDGNVRPDFFHVIGQVEPAQMRHRLVRDDQVEFVESCLERFQGFDTADPRAHLVPELQQHLAVGVTDDFFIIHKKNPPSSAGMHECRMQLYHGYGQLSRGSNYRKALSGITKRHPHTRLIGRWNRI